MVAQRPTLMCAINNVLISAVLLFNMYTVHALYHFTIRLV